MSIAETRRDQIFPRVSQAQLAVVARYGKRRTFRTGETLFAEGDRHSGSFFVLSGGVEIFRRDALGGKHRITIHGPGEFTGEVSSLAGRANVATGRAVEDSDVLWVDEAALRNLVVAHADLSELIMRAFILRRVALIQDGTGSIALVGSRHSADTLRLSEFLTRNGQPFAYLDIEADKDTGAFLERFGVGVGEVPVVICRGSIVLKNPTNRQLADCIGLGPESDGGPRLRRCRGRRRAGRPRRGRVRGIGRPERRRGRRESARRAGRQQLEDRELSRLSDREFPARRSPAALSCRRRNSAPSWRCRAKWSGSNAVPTVFPW